MLTWRVKVKEKSLTILFFPNGTIQCVGNSDESDVENLHVKLCKVLHIDFLPPWKVKSMTVLCSLCESYDLRFLASNKSVTYEVELFPAAQFALWKHIHVHAFHNGKLIITGITTVRQVYKVVNDVVEYLNSNYKKFE